MTHPKAIELTSHRVNGLNEALRLFAVGPRTHGGAYHEYLLLLPDETAALSAVQVDGEAIVTGTDHFQISEQEELVVDNTIGTAMIVKGSKGESFRVTYLDFQNGPVKDVGYTGISNEALIAVLIHRLQAFQEGPFKSQENEFAWAKLEEARLWLHKRALDRVARGVEGTYRA